ncbi:probable enoyl-CoA hydratase [Topomyia yanbarensis]|uniref:probable enoyl-CoA hydratase n=1 Tax=Topomyia yanbarensis TaxID=2498891 RepID=UPI00273BE34F|nr:probable enoyl-CoA hydratase [Topomyia yanbarensis]
MWPVIKASLRFTSISRGTRILRLCSTIPPKEEVSAPDQKPAEEPSILVEKMENITMIGLNKPDIRNAINSEMGRQLSAAVEAFENDETSAVGILHGIGGSFCAGYDLTELANPNVKPQSIILQRGGVMGPTRRNFKKPMICAISGYCVAGGLELALMCDLRVMEEIAILGLYNRRFGVPLVDGGTVRLPALIGISRAMDLVLTGRPIRAKEALQIGLVNRVVAVGTGLGQAYNLATTIAKFPQDCVNHDRTSMYYSAFQAKSLEDAMDYEVLSANEKLLTQAVTGAERFLQGVGKHGKFTDIKERIIPDWEKEEIAHEMAAAARKKPSQ